MSTNRVSEAAARRLLTTCPDDRFVATLREVLTRYQIESWLTINQAAELADMSVRSFQRRLAEQGETYGQLSDAIKAKVAKHLLENTDHSLSEIASALGYTERTNFVRAFKRWTGLTPKQFRNN